MNYAIEWSSQALSFLDGLQKDIAERILRKFDDVKENPFRYLKHYWGYEGYKLRIGDYRALIDIDFQNKILFIRMLDKNQGFIKNDQIFQTTDNLDGSVKMLNAKKVAK